MENDGNNVESDGHIVENDGNMMQQMMETNDGKIDGTKLLVKMMEHDLPKNLDLPCFFFLVNHLQMGKKYLPVVIEGTLPESSTSRQRKMMMKQ